MHADLPETETEADAMADTALRELGEIPLDLHDEYDELWEYAGCYPWLGETIHLPPHGDGRSGYHAGDDIDSCLC